jgi:hypothetical protein
MASKLIRKIDQLGSEIRLSLEGELLFQTVLGGIFTIILTIISISLLIVFRVQIIFKRNCKCNNFQKFSKRRFHKPYK